MVEDSDDDSDDDSDKKPPPKSKKAPLKPKSKKPRIECPVPADQGFRAWINDLFCDQYVEHLESRRAAAEMRKAFAGGTVPPGYGKPYIAPAWLECSQVRGALVDYAVSADVNVDEQLKVLPRVLKQLAVDGSRGAKRDPPSLKSATVKRPTKGGSQRISKATTVARYSVSPAFFKSRGEGKPQSRPKSKAKPKSLRLWKVWGKYQKTWASDTRFVRAASREAALALACPLTPDRKFYAIDFPTAWPNGVFGLWANVYGFLDANPGTGKYMPKATRSCPTWRNRVYVTERYCHGTDARGVAELGLNVEEVDMAKGGQVEF